MMILGNYHAVLRELLLTKNIEVKSGKNYTLSSIQKLRKKYAEQTENAVVIHTGDLKDAGEILYIPLYMTMLL